MPPKSLLEESAAEELRTDHWRWVRHQECDNERWCDRQSAALGHGRARKVPCNHCSSLPQGFWLPHCVWHHEPQDVLEPEVLANHAAWLGRAGHLHYACGQQARPGRGGPPPTSSNAVGSVAVMQSVQQEHDVRGDKYYHEHPCLKRLSRPAARNLRAQADEPNQFSSRRSQDLLTWRASAVDMVCRLQLMNSIEDPLL